MPGGGEMTGVRRVPRRQEGPTNAMDDELVRELHAMLSRLVERAPLFADLRRRGVTDDLVQDTLIAVTRRIGRGPIDDPFTYATRCVENLARRTYVQSAREHPISDETLELLAPALEDVADHVERRMEMGEVLEMIRLVNGVIADLVPLELELVRAELARTDQKQLAARLGISRPTLYRRKGPAISAFVAAVAERAGTHPCPEHAGALLAAAGLSGFEAAKSAATHAATCEECSATIRHLAVARHGLAMIAPIPLVAATPDASRMAERFHAVFETAADWVRTLVLRTGDPMPLGGSTAKTVALVAAACTGGGGVYCAVDGVPTQITAPFAHHARPHAQRAATAATVRTTAAVGTNRYAAMSQATSQLATVVHKVEHDATAARAAARARAVAEQRRREAAAARMRQAQAAREFAARQRAAAPATREFSAAAPGSTATTITRREFTTPAGGGSGTGSSSATKEFGTP